MFNFLLDAATVEIARLAGFDFVIIDMEHSPRDWADLAGGIRAANSYDIIPLVRVPRLDETTISQVLELGAAGIVVPFVRTAADARRAGFD